MVQNIVSSRMASAMAPLSLSNADELFNLEEKKTGSSSGGLCLTLQKLYIWEKKLYNEVKVCIICLKFDYINLVAACPFAIYAFNFVC